MWGQRSTRSRNARRAWNKKLINDRGIKMWQSPSSPVSVNHSTGSTRQTQCTDCKTNKQTNKQDLNSNGLCSFGHQEALFTLWRQLCIPLHLFTTLLHHMSHYWYLRQNPEIKPYLISGISKCSCLTSFPLLFTFPVFPPDLHPLPVLRWRVSWHTKLFPGQFRHRCWRWHDLMKCTDSATKRTQSWTGGFL